MYEGLPTAIPNPSHSLDTSSNPPATTNGRFDPPGIRLAGGRPGNICHGSSDLDEPSTTYQSRDAMSLHGLGVIGAQVAASIKSNDEKIPTPKIRSPSGSVQSTPRIEIEHTRSLDYDPSIGAKPYSPFYSHGTPTISYEQLTFETKNASRNRSGLRDLENAGPYSYRSDSPRRSKLWEGKAKPRSCLQSLSTRQRMIFKAIIAVVTVGTMIAIALGITYAVGGAVWKSSDEQTSLGG